VGYEIPSETKDILIIIENLRKELEELIKTKEENDEEILAASKKLDTMLNMYYRLIKNKDK